MIGDVRVLERVTRVAPLGVRFWDASTARPVVDGLEVWVYPEGRPDRRSAARPNPSGVFVAHDLPGLRDASFGEGDEAYWAGVARRPFVVEVSDANRHFLPFTLAVELPARGTVALEEGSPPSPLGAPGAAVPLFSTASRPVPAGSAVVRAELWDSALDRAASWAVLEAEYDGEFLGSGVADGEGRVALIFAYPPPPDVPPPPDGDASIGPAGLTWPIRLTVRYEPEADPTPVVPDLGRVLGQRLASFVDFPSPTGELPLVLRRELVVASSPRLVLLVNPAA